MRRKDKNSLVDDGDVIIRRFRESGNPVLFRRFLAPAFAGATARCDAIAKIILMAPTFGGWGRYFTCVKTHRSHEVTSKWTTLDGFN